MTKDLGGIFDKSLSDILKDGKNIPWSNSDFNALLKAKSAEEISNKLMMVAGCITSLNDTVHKAVNKLTISSERLLEANSKYTKALCYLTGALLLIALMPLLGKAAMFVVQ